MTKHTQGPWTVNSSDLERFKSNGGSIDIDAPDDISDGCCVAMAYGGPANAHLISAAPDMLEALELVFLKCVDAINDLDGDFYLSNDDKAMVRAAIAKTKGE